MATLILPTGEMHPWIPNKGETRLQTWQRAVGGLIEPVYCKDGRVLLVNEEGLLERLPHNPYASRIANQGHNPDDYEPAWRGYFLVGPALLLSGDEWADE